MLITHSLYLSLSSSFYDLVKINTNFTNPSLQAKKIYRTGPIVQTEVDPHHPVSGW